MMESRYTSNQPPAELTSQEKGCLKKIKRLQLKADVGEALFGVDNFQTKKLSFPLREMD